MIKKRPTRHLNRMALRRMTKSSTQRMGLQSMASTRIRVSSKCDRLVVLALTNFLLFFLSLIPDTVFHFYFLHCCVAALVQIFSIQCGSVFLFFFFLVLHHCSFQQNFEQCAKAAVFLALSFYWNRLCQMYCVRVCVSACV